MNDDKLGYFIVVANQFSLAPIIFLTHEERRHLSQSYLRAILVTNALLANHAGRRMQEFVMPLLEVQKRHVDDLD